MPMEDNIHIKMPHNSKSYQRSKEEWQRQQEAYYEAKKLKEAQEVTKQQRLDAVGTDVLKISLSLHDSTLQIAEAYDKGYIAIGTNDTTMFLAKKKSKKL